MGSSPGRSFRALNILSRFLNFLPLRYSSDDNDNFSYGHGEGVRPPFEPKHLGVEPPVLWIRELLRDPHAVQVAIDELAFIELSVVGRHDAPLSARNGFPMWIRSLQAEARYIAGIADLLPVPFRTSTVRCILDDCDPMAVTYGHQGIHVTHLAPKVYGIDRPRVPSYPPLRIPGVYEQRLRIYIAEDRTCTHVQCPTVGTDVADRWGDHLIAGSNACGIESACKG